MSYLGFDRMDVEDEDNYSTTTQLYLNPDKDEEKMGTFIFDHATPYAYAAGFIKKWRSFLLHMSMVFINTFVDMIRHLDTEFDTVVDCVANGVIPDLDGIVDLRHHLEPNLRLVNVSASGSFASSVPLARSFLGPDVDIHFLGYATTECSIGTPYNPFELNHFKLIDYEIIELLDISESESIGGIAQLWEVEVGKRYEPVLTTRDGLWRHRLGDIVEVSGFDPADGVPIIQFVGRGNMGIRFPDFLVTEEELRAAMSSSVVLNMSIKVINRTAAIDDPSIPATIGIHSLFHETRFPLDIGTPASDLALAPERLLDELSRSNNNVVWALGHDVFCKPTIRIVRSGTFSDFLQLKLDEGSKNTGQIKVPVVLSKAAYVTWFANRVVQEFSRAAS
ncbi:GH3 auxin-responsive promoter-domain-containing protein [Boletus edulis BED1]|uniref:GH3 auxin-responsive promoter-domain-containing protein n=1 Tax=Boletus edulis BED1 TaxID=1328754 RepID=A0AAD4G6I9_BOLED|nr:GH3 auxin-responsive promoter-domain-containing protein [Boletus edulis BED1]